MNNKTSTTYRDLLSRYIRMALNRKNIDRVNNAYGITFFMNLNLLYTSISKLQYKIMSKKGNYLIYPNF